MLNSYVGFSPALSGPATLAQRIEAVIAFIQTKDVVRATTLTEHEVWQRGVDLSAFDSEALLLAQDLMEHAHDALRTGDLGLATAALVNAERTIHRRMLLS